jgi:hypothetical protein
VTILKRRDDILNKRNSGAMMSSSDSFNVSSPKGQNKGRDSFGKSDHSSFSKESLIKMNRVITESPKKSISIDVDDEISPMSKKVSQREMFEKEKHIMIKQANLDDSESEIDITLSPSRVVSNDVIMSRNVLYSLKFTLVCFKFFLTLSKCRNRVNFQISKP